MEEKKANTRETNTKKAWISTGILALVSIVLWIAGLKSSAVVLFGILLIWVGIAYREIKEPEVGFLFQMGKYKGKLKPGWHLGLPFIWGVETRTTGTQEIIFKEQMYTKARKAIGLRGGIYYRMVNPENAITLPKNIIKSRIKNVVLSKLKGKIGEMAFDELLRERGGVEKKVKQDANDKDELGKDGYEVTGIEITDLNEQIESEAAKIKEIGEAEAEIDKKKAEAIAEPLKNNYPAAITMAARAIGDKIVSRSKKKS